MKEAELRAAATCIMCNRKIDEAQSPMFYRVTIERHMLDLSALQRQQGLGMMIGGALALHMGSDEDMTTLLMRGDITICDQCGVQDVCIAELAERMGDVTPRPEAIGSPDVNPS